MALGFGGQYIVVVPDHDVVAVFTSGMPGVRFASPESLVADYVLGSIVADGPLPRDPDGIDRLAAAVEALGTAPEATAPDLPALVADVAGVRYEFRPNDFGNEWFEFTFGEDTAGFEFEDRDGPIEVEVGLDGRFRVSEAWGLPWAWRGTWADADTFRVEYHIVGLAQRGTLSFTFDGDLAHLLFTEVVTGTTQSSTADRVG
jgi:hypothetical protein